MAIRSHGRHLRVGLQTKSVVILAFVVVAVMVAGGWFYFAAARACLRNSDHGHALRMSQALCLAAQQDLQQRRNGPLQRLASDFIRNDSVRYVALLDADGVMVASAADADPAAWAGLAQIPVTVSSICQVNEDVLSLARPIVVPRGAEGRGQVVGAVRLVLDTSATTTALAHVQKRMSVIAATIVLCAIPLGYMLVWRVMVQPVRNLVRVTRRLAGGDFTARAGLKRNDEIGELAHAFDAMAGELASSHAQLILANERLERKVAERTRELQRANARMREEMAEKEDFLRAVSHDLNAPLRNIAGMATMAMVQWGGALPEEVVARLQRIQANVDVETSLISELLELSRIRTRPQKREVVDTQGLLEDLARTFEFELKSRNIDFTVRGPLPHLYVEKNRIRQVFQNLIDNAIKYMDRSTGGVIEVGYRFLDGTHQFRVQDNGPGIPEVDQSKIFYVFRRSGNAAGVEGRGVGLTVVKNVVSNYEGKAWVRSEPGRGSTFYIALDARCTKPPAREQAHAPGEGDSRIKAGHHLVG